MIANKQELEVTKERIKYFQNLLENIREKSDPRQFEYMASGYRMEIERMHAEVMDYLLRPVAQEEAKQPA
jgi:hypothetical protein